MDNFADIIKKIMDTPTTPLDIFKIAGKRCNVYEYPEIMSFGHIDDLFELGNSDIESLCEDDLPFDKKCAIILYKSSDDFGHWCLIKKHKDSYHFLDSYGGQIDESLEHSDKSMLGQDKNYLAKLLADSEKDVYYNHNPLQKLDDKIATCGHYCAMFLKYSDLSVDDFAELIKTLADRHGISNDVAIAILTIS